MAVLSGMLEGKRACLFGCEEWIHLLACMVQKAEAKSDREHPFRYWSCLLTMNFAISSDFEHPFV